MKQSLIILFATYFISLNFAVGQSITEQIRAEGKSISVSNSLGRFEPLWNAADNSNVKVTRDLKYGPDNKQGFDLYEPKNIPKTKSPILIFLHGGSFVAGDKAMYANVGYYFAKKGITSVVMTYRLAPEFKWPTGTIDLALQLKWLRDNPDKVKTGDVRKIFLFGHSAGAQHVASYIFEEEYQIENDGVNGAILASGSVYDTDILNHDADPQYYDYFGRDSSKYASMSVLNKLDGRKMPIFIASAEYDKANFEYQANTILNALYNRDKSLPMYKQVMDNNHLSEIFHFNTGDETFGPDILKFIHSKVEKN
ncbi:MAG: alpha/beta hydrolase [Kordiimonadaceae bacterium]|nr:alpha/beta hydrolase [Kordiimonadaceae bacterium]